MAVWLVSENEKPKKSIRTLFRNDNSRQKRDQTAALERGKENLKASKAQQIEADRTREEQHAQLLAIVEATHDAIILKNLEGHYQLVNAAVGKITGIPMEQLIGKSDREILPDAFVDHFAEEDNRIIATGETLESVFDASAFGGTGIWQSITQQSRI